MWLCPHMPQTGQIPTEDLRYTWLLSPLPWRTASLEEEKALAEGHLARTGSQGLLMPKSPAPQ